MIEPWKLAATIVTVIVISLISFITNYWLTRRACRTVSHEDEEVEEDTRTPEELFEEKLFREEYDAALEIARIHGLNSDLVYQKQWNKADVSVESIDNFLSKVLDHHWVFGECLERIPQDLSSNKYLLDFGIELTESVVDFDESGDYHLLNNEQRQIVLYRKRLLQFRDRLLTYEHIISGDQVNFHATIYEKFRRQELFESCLQFCREGDHRAVATLFTYNGAQTLEHWLPLLSQIPEVVRPYEYRSLLPEAGLTQNEEDVYPWEEVKPRIEDWSEKMVPEPPEESPQLFYATHPHLGEYRGKQLTKSVVSKWFCVRSRQIEQCTSLISNALELVQLGIERNFPDLAGLHARLDTFATLIYDCLPRADDQDIDLTFEKFSKLSSDEIVKLLMSGCKKDANTFIKCLRQSLLPYLMRYDPRHSEGRCQGSLENFLVECARESLHLVRAVFEQSIFDPKLLQDDGNQSINRSPIITNVKDLLNLAAKCINECTNEDFLNDAFAIIECLPQRSDADPPDIKPLQDEIDTLENNLAVIELLEKNGCRVLMSELKSIQKNSKDAKRLFNEMIRKGSKRPGFKILDENHWKQLLQEALQARSDCFPSTITEPEINEIFIKTLLSHGREENFDLAYNFMKSMDTGQMNQLILDCSRDYVNSAGSTGDKTIALAKKCLHLLPQDTLNNQADVREELDLIGALEVIDEFWTLPLLPVQIRLMDQPRIQLIYHLLQHNKAYKQISRVLQVAHLARVYLDCDPTIRDGKVLIVLGEAAIDDQDFKSCWNVCERLMDLECHESWKLCLNLALNTNSLSHKLSLLSFALTYCEDGDHTAKRINQILNLIEKSRLQLEQEQSSLRGLADVNLINLNVLSAGAQLGEEVVVKTASHLTSWLIPKFQGKRNEGQGKGSKSDTAVTENSESRIEEVYLRNNEDRSASAAKQAEVNHDGNLVREQLEPSEGCVMEVCDPKFGTQVALKKEDFETDGWEVEEDSSLEADQPFDSCVDESDLHIREDPLSEALIDTGIEVGHSETAGCVMEGNLKDTELIENDALEKEEMKADGWDHDEDMNFEVGKPCESPPREECPKSLEGQIYEEKRKEIPVHGWDVDDDFDLDEEQLSGSCLKVGDSNVVEEQICEAPIKEKVATDVSDQVQNQDFDERKPPETLAGKIKPCYIEKKIEQCLDADVERFFKESDESASGQTIDQGVIEGEAGGRDLDENMSFQVSKPCEDPAREESPNTMDGRISEDKRKEMPVDGWDVDDDLDLEDEQLSGSCLKVDDSVVIDEQICEAPIKDEVGADGSELVQNQDFDERKPSESIAEQSNPCYIEKKIEQCLNADVEVESCLKENSSTAPGQIIDPGVIDGETDGWDCDENLEDLLKSPGNVVNEANCTQDKIDRDIKEVNDQPLDLVLDGCKQFESCATQDHVHNSEEQVNVAQKMDADGWEVDEELELEESEQTESCEKHVPNSRMEDICGTKIEKIEVDGWEHQEDLDLDHLDSPSENKGEHPNDLNAKQRSEEKSGWECEDELLIDSFEEESGWTHE